MAVSAVAACRCGACARLLNTPAVAAQQEAVDKGLCWWANCGEHLGQLNVKDAHHPILAEDRQQLLAVGVGPAPHKLHVLHALAGLGQMDRLEQCL